MSDNSAEFLPFNAINEFMRPDFRTRVLQEVFENLPSLPNSDQNSFNKLIRKFLVVPGFRNSTAAPVFLKLKSAGKPFEKNASFTAEVIHHWSQIHVDLREHTYKLLSDLGWTILPVEADRTKLPGFLTVWPKGQDFSTLNTAYREKYPQDNISEDDISLMAVWLSGRLPIHEDDTSNSTHEEN